MPEAASARQVVIVRAATCTWVAAARLAGRRQNCAAPADDAAEVREPSEHAQVQLSSSAGPLFPPPHAAVFWIKSAGCCRGCSGLTVFPNAAHLGSAPFG